MTHLLYFLILFMHFFKHRFVYRKPRNHNPLFQSTCACTDVVFWLMFAAMIVSEKGKIILQCQWFPEIFRTDLASLCTLLWLSFSWSGESCILFLSYYCCWGYSLLLIVIFAY
uniref:Uncharacterized protein n=1 Tax=Arundo donax TaxID=35708 RepID=A0A0A9BYB8_ARUDO